MRTSTRKVRLGALERVSTSGLIQEPIGIKEFKYMHCIKVTV